MKKCVIHWKTDVIQRKSVTMETTIRFSATAILFFCSRFLKIEYERLALGVLEDFWVKQLTFLSRMYQFNYLDFILLIDLICADFFLNQINKTHLL